MWRSSTSRKWATLRAGDDLVNVETIKVDLAVPAPFAGEMVR